MVQRILGYVFLVSPFLWKSSPSFSSFPTFSTLKVFANPVGVPSVFMLNFKNLRVLLSPRFPTQLPWIPSCPVFSIHYKEPPQQMYTITISWLWFLVLNFQGFLINKRISCYIIPYILLSDAQLAFHYEALRKKALSQWVPCNARILFWLKVEGGKEVKGCQRVPKNEMLLWCLQCFSVSLKWFIVTREGN